LGFECIIKRVEFKSNIKRVKHKIRWCIKGAFSEGMIGNPERMNFLKKGISYLKWKSLN
jgi:hypothetical protein